MGTVPITKPIPEEIESVLNWCFREALRDELGYSVNTYIREQATLSGDQDIQVNYYYYEKYNKCFFEYDFGVSIRNSVNVDRFRVRFNRYIEQNFKYQINIWPELLFNDYEDKTTIAGTLDKLTPYTIGYMKCINGRYEFLYDKQVILNDMRAYIPVLGKKPAKNIEEFYATVESIAKKYAQVQLTSEKQEEFYKKYVQVFLNYHGTEQYKIKLAELEEEYGIKDRLNSKIPEIYAEYIVEYKKFFGKDLLSTEIPITKYYIYVALK